MSEPPPAERAEATQLIDALRRLPLCDELFLGMQALNVHFVDGFLEEQEADLLRQYVEIERTPLPAAIFVSALSQMWIFGLYELLRTWRQRVRELLKWAEEVSAVEPAERPGLLAQKRREVERRGVDALDVGSRWVAFEQATDPAFAKQLRVARDSTERTFRVLESVRVTLAKHEVPRGGGLYALAPGYGRIDMGTGSISWQVELGDDEVAVVTRREIADACRELALPNPRILPVAVQEQVAPLPREAYGLKRVAVTLDDGAEFLGVWIAWGKEVVRVENHEFVPFDVARMVGVRHDPTSESNEGQEPF
jgi:hypothetical protein